MCLKSRLDFKGENKSIVIGRSKKNFVVGIGVGIVGCLFVALYGCVKPPIKEIADAEVALAAARSIGAENYLKEAYKDVEKKLDEARLMAEEQKYKPARILALESANEARQIKSQAERVKEKARKDAEKALATTHKAICELEEKRAINYDIEEYMAILNLFREVQKEYDEERYLQVIEKAGSITQRCNALQKKAREIEAQKKGELLRLEKAKQLKKAEGLVEEKKKKVEIKEHVVQFGECLWKICQEAQVYNNPLIWPIVYKANRSQIRDPDLIYPGQRIIIPRQLAQDQIEEVSLEAKSRGSWSLYDNR